MSAWGRLASCQLVRLAGGKPVCLAPGIEPPDGLEGLLVTGGSDIDPAHYGQPGGPFVAPDPIRDQYELAALEFARLHELPVLGICRGAQLINVVSGGTLHSDITELRQVTSNRPSLLPRKTVTLDSDSRLAALMGSVRFGVNSLHHQAVKALGRDLRIVGRDEDGIVQAIESIGTRLVVGVQWHPEYLPWQGRQRRLFHALVRHAAQP